jgi:hypothetical protein
MHLGYIYYRNELNIYEGGTTRKLKNKDYAFDKMLSFESHTEGAPR